MKRNSLLAYWNGQLGEFSTREVAVLKALENLGIATDREVKVWLNLGDMNDVRPRITELIKDGLIEEIGTCECEVTHQPVRKLRIKARPALVRPVDPQANKTVITEQAELFT